jgi:hypothetical protein
MLTIEIPVKTTSEVNVREHWAVKRRRRISQQQEVNAEWKAAIKRKKIHLPCVVTFTRIAPKLLDDDNLRSAFKGIRDEVARLLGVDDGSTLVRFDYLQTPIGKREYRIKIEVRGQ